MGTIMTKIKLCGLSRLCDIEAANILAPDYVGFVFASGSRRFVSAQKARELKKSLHPGIGAVGVFVNESPEIVAGLLESKTIDIAQLHGIEDESYMKKLRTLTQKPIIKAFRVDTKQDIETAMKSSADFILLDSGSGGTGTALDWKLIRSFQEGGHMRPYFLAGGLNPYNIKAAVEMLHPYGVDVSSGIESEGLKDKEKMREFVRAVRGKDGKE